jgi:hypothetical protein
VAHPRSDSAHLTEAERQTLADGSLATRQARGLQAHLRACPSCAADVERLRLIARRYREPAPRDPMLAGLWPEIRSRIERRKVVPIPPGAASPRPAPSFRRSVLLITGTAAGLAAAVLWLKPARLGPGPGSDQARTRDSIQTLVLVADSIRSYREEAQALLDRLELQRAMIRPEAMASIERDLGVIDRSIEELELAIQRDPRNPVLRELLVSSYRQKVDVLKRVGNAG